MSQPEYEFSMLGLKFSGSEMWVLAAGFVGSALSLQFFRPMPWYERGFLLLSGTVTTHYLTPLASGVLRLFGLGSYENAVGFLIGVFGMAFIWAILSVLTMLGTNPFDVLRMLTEKVKRG